MYQQTILIGNLGDTPTMRYTPSGVAVTSFSLAVNRKWTFADGEPQEKVTWFRITTWRKQAEICSEYLTKGSKVMVIGEIEEARPWTDKDGNNRASLEVTAKEVRFLSSRNGDSGQDRSTPVASPNQDGQDNDIPF